MHGSNRVRKNSMGRVFWEGHEFTRANKFANLSFRGGFSRRGIWCSEFFRNL